MLWVWERKTDLRFLKPEQAGVAFLAASIYIDKDELRSNPRLEPLLLPPGVYRMAVIRIDSVALQWKARTVSECAAIVEAAFRVTHADALQIDYDAPSAAMSNYRALASDVRRRIGPGVFLSLTMLASTCSQSAELTGFPADELVAMWFRTGPGGWPAVAPPCSGSVGIALKTEHPLIHSFRRIYAFPDWFGANLESWTAENVKLFLTQNP